MHALLIVGLAIACGGDDRLPPSDGGAGDGDVPRMPGEVTPAALPTLTPCPEGWAVVRSSDGIDECEPPAAAMLAAPVACPPGTALFASSSACTPLGPACPTETFPDVSMLPSATRTLYVRPGAIGGDGTRARPFSTIGEAARLGLAGTLIVVAAGEYDERVDLFAGVSLLGVCAAETRIAPTGASIEPAVRMAEPDASVSRVTIAPAGPVVGIDVFSSVRLEDVIVEGATGGGVYLRRGAALDATRLAVHGTRRGDGFDSAGAIVLDQDATATVDSLAIADADGSAIAALEVGGSFTASDAAISDVGLDDAIPRALLAQAGASIALTESVLVRPHGAIAAALDGGATIELRDVLVRGVRSATEASIPEQGVTGSHGALVLERVRFEHIGAFAVGALQYTSASVTDVVVRDFGNAPTQLGIAFVVGAESTLTLRRAFVTDAKNAALFGSGIGAGKVAGGPGPSLDIEDFTLVRANEDGSVPGYGMALNGGAHGTLRRVSLTGVRGDAILAADAGTELAFEDLAVLDGREQGDGRYGRALEVQTGAHVVVDRMRVERSTEIAIIAAGEGAEVMLARTAILDTRARPCAETTCSSAPGGTALGVTAGARASMRSFLIEGAPLCGLQVANDGQIDLQDGVVRGAAIGACVQVDGFDLERVTGSVRYENNEINVDTTEHAVPEPATIDLGF